MKFQFDPNLDHQTDAIRSVCDVFEGQETCETLFTLTSDLPLAFGDSDNDEGIGNRLHLLPEDVLANVQQIQLANGLAVSKSLTSRDFTVEMETGTGKTYVYLRSIFEMNKRYGFTKFIIVVPSVAIKEGVYKSLQMTESHFAGLYENTRCDYFVYDSSKLSDVRKFASNDCIQIMVINIQAFNKSFANPDAEKAANIIHRRHERMSGAKPIDFIAQTNPIVIIDEPQSVDTTSTSSTAIESLNPLCTFRYSATHRDDYAKLYRLDAVDAYERHLVKRIEVAGIETEDSHNRAYIKLLRVDNKKSPITASVELDVAGTNGKVSRKKKTVRSGEDLFEVSGGREIYLRHIIDDIYCEKGKEYISFTGRDTYIKLGEAVGDVDDDAIRRQQIARTIQEHLDKEARLHPRGIKVLSLFFIDRVANYRWYDEQGYPQLGKYAEMFEEEYAKLIKRPRYDTLFDSDEARFDVRGLHDGYFAIDRQKDAFGSERLRETSQGHEKYNDSVYNLIMRDKERLLSFDSRLKFIFSHSALREGWDNPNVFQICTLNESTSVIKKRQEIGRGLRIAVNQDGERVHGFDVNTLTVMANESYEDFARALQREIEDDTGIRFGVVEKHMFASIPVEGEDGKAAPLGTKQSEQIWNHLLGENHIDAKGRVQDALRTALAEGQVSLPEDVGASQAAIQAVLKKVAGSLTVRDARKRRKVTLNKQVFLSDDFKELWDRIKYKTTFHVDFDPEALKKTCIDTIKRDVLVGEETYALRKARVDVTRGGVIAEEEPDSGQVYGIHDDNRALPDIVTFLQNETNLTRQTLVYILMRSEKLDHFERNPQRFIEQVTAIIRNKMQLALVDGIKYERIGEDHFYTQELFEDEELYGYLHENMIEAQKSIYEHVVYDSDVEKQIASVLQNRSDVRVFAKLPGWFKIETPLGGYNPDWAMLVEKNGEEHLYFVVETKGTMLLDALRPSEQAKIDCGRAHFDALGTDVTFGHAADQKSLNDLISSG